MFDPVDPRQSFPSLEHGILSYWEEEDIFHRSISQRDGAESFSFFDGPPFATGLPHYGHLLAGTIKDVIPRYQTMRGKKVERRFGWDCHGLLVEYEIEKEHDIKGRHEIEEMGVKAFNDLCRGIVQRYTKEWKATVERTGRWVDMDHDYRTMDPSYMESIWWVFSSLYEKGLIYEGFKPMHVCPRCMTPLANFEVTQGYKDVTDQSATVMFRLEDANQINELKHHDDIVLRTPKSKTELDSLHRLREKEIFIAHHGSDFIYDRNHPDDQKPMNHLFVLIHKKDVIGTLRIDILDEHRAALRLVVIDSTSQKEGFGRIMIELAEKEIQRLGRHIVVLHAYKGAIGFYRKCGYSEIDAWEAGTSLNAGNVDMGKTLKKVNMNDTENAVYLLAWTTTPWTLPGNLFLAVNPETPYVKVSHDEKVFIVAESLAEKVFAGKEYEIVGKPFKGSSLVGKTYVPLFNYFEHEYKKSSFRIVAGDFVTTEDGTGIVHIAPGFGEDDFAVGQREFGKDFKPLQHVLMDGHFVKQVTDFAGMEVKPKDDPSKMDTKIIQFLEQQKGLFSKSSYKHSYPHCWRCDSPLLNYATGSWFVKVEQIKDDMLTVNAETEWVPAHLRDGRFGKWLENAHDWAISRNRYWGTPLPIWRAKETGDIVVINSRDDLMTHVKDRFTKISVLRHGESEGNLIPIYQSSIPGTDLTATGKKQAKKAAVFLNEMPQAPTVIYCSPIARTKQTAEAIAKETGATLIVDERLREVDVGEYEGKTIPRNDLQISGQLRKEKAALKTPQSLYHLPGMEPWESILGRITDFFEDILPKHKNDHVVVVSHGDPMYCIHHFLTKEDPFKIVKQKNAPFATPTAYFWDHTTNAAMDLHKDVVDDLTWPDRDGNLYRRIPDVLDCWFESGSMPYAQNHFPFAMGSEKFPKGFPADFIAEGIDQTRGWFYTLTVLSAALFKKPAFLNCVVNGTVLAEDGRKMSKRLKNYPDPVTVIDKYGADALRFALMSSPAVRADDLRFSEPKVEEVIRSVLLPLWNSYSFFVTYANAAGFEPSSKPRMSRHPLDQWIRSEVQDLVNRMTEQLDNYDLSATCNELGTTIDALTNWYIRLSRRRFAGKNAEGFESYVENGEIDQQEALTTLHEVLVTISQLLAPFCPFVTESIYLNLAGEPHGSVHLTDWPQTRKLKSEETVLLQKNRILRLIVRLGNKIRSEKKIKVRQPLSKVTIALPTSVFDASTLATEDLQLLRQELNVKEVLFIDDAGALGEAIAMVDARKVGPRLGKRVQEVIQAGKRGEFTEQDGEILILDERLSPDEVQVIYRGREGEDIAAERGIVVSLETILSEELIAEGFARDIIRSVQRLRKEANLQHTDKISLSIEGMDDVVKLHGKHIAQETNATLGDSTGDVMTVDIEDTKISIRFHIL